MFKTGTTVAARIGCVNDTGNLTSEGTSMPALANLATVILDCADPAALAGFYSTVTGWPRTYADDDFVFIGDGSGVQLGFQRVEGYRPAGWPDLAKHAHLDFKVSDVDGAVPALLAAGASKPEFQPGKGSWVVLTDPEGHPFCLTG
jgi:predicted enzyme related to lactoylglutathione lyase